jgi:1-acyl-sn-glycerol-3-phosphate acyltransferase
VNDELPRRRRKKPVPSARAPRAKARAEAKPKRASPRRKTAAKPPSSSLPPPGERIDPEEIHAVSGGDGHPSLAELEKALASIAARLPSDERDARRASSVWDGFASEHYLRAWERAGLRARSEQVDDFGLDPAYEVRYAPLFELLYRRWFRASVDGIDNVPRNGRALLVCNRAGLLPWDAVVLKTAIRLEHPRNDLRWLTEDTVFHMPFLGAFVNRIGGVRACQENAERLLAAERLVAVFPEGEKGVAKLFRRRYHLQRFGRGGYIKLALRTGAPIVPTAIVGSEEAMPLLFKVGGTSGLFGVPFLPITPTFPWLGPAGLVPLPFKWRVVFGEPIDVSSHGAAAADDAAVVNRLNDTVRSEIAALIQRARAI